MWLFTTFGFFSIVQDKTNPQYVWVRARAPHDLDILRGRYLPGLTDTVRTPNRDYRYRAWVSKHELAEAMPSIVMDINYTNFKDAVPDHAHHNAYLGVWGAMFDAQSRGEFCTADRTRSSTYDYGDWDSKPLTGQHLLPAVKVEPKTTKALEAKVVDPKVTVIHPVARPAAPKTPAPTKKSSGRVTKNDLPFWEQGNTIRGDIDIPTTEELWEDRQRANSQGGKRGD
jgi:hypothetical protein